MTRGNIEERVYQNMRELLAIMSTIPGFEKCSQLDLYNDTDLRTFQEYGNKFLEMAQKLHEDPLHKSTAERIMLYLESSIDVIEGKVSY